MCADSHGGRAAGPARCDRSAGALSAGLFCLVALWSVDRHADAGIARPMSTLDDRMLMVLAPLFFINYVVNIGFAKVWGQRPLIVSWPGCSGPRRKDRCGQFRQPDPGPAADRLAGLLLRPTRHLVRAGGFDRHTGARHRGLARSPAGRAGPGAGLPGVVH